MKCPVRSDCRVVGGQWEAQDGGAGTGWDGWRALRERVRVRGGMRMTGDKGKGSS